MYYPTRSEELLERHAFSARKYVQTHKPIDTFPPGEPRSEKYRILISITTRKSGFKTLDNNSQSLALINASSQSSSSAWKGEVPVIRNAGGRAKNAVFDVAVLDALVQVTEIIVIHHKDCGLTYITDEDVREELGKLSPEEVAKYDTDGYTFTLANIHQSVKNDIVFLRSHPFVRKETKVSGFAYDIESGNLEPVEG
ncbi:carbonic anhydrase [Lophiotrema nucula]|uniref:Carbonic anhydrase n=1 Tax=Lophiotrema nucula TaxID=690887 RepID=A0A6A5ZQE9_9PLEO|nr:carbonic anhydrase [Lophiotrema nucula]